MGAGTSKQGLKDSALGFVGGVTAVSIMGYGLYYLWRHLSWFWIILIVGVWCGIFVYDSRVKKRAAQEVSKRIAAMEERERQREQGNMTT